LAKFVGKYVKVLSAGAKWTGSEKK
jgi:hypothetical protein